MSQASSWLTPYEPQPGTPPRPAALPPSVRIAGVDPWPTPATATPPPPPLPTEVELRSELVAANEKVRITGEALAKSERAVADGHLLVADRQAAVAAFGDLAADMTASTVAALRQGRVAELPTDRIAARQIAVLECDAARSALAELETERDAAAAAWRAASEKPAVIAFEVLSHGEALRLAEQRVGLLDQAERIEQALRGFNSATSWPARVPEAVSRVGRIDRSDIIDGGQWRREARELVADPQHRVLIDCTVSWPARRPIDNTKHPDEQTILRPMIVERPIPSGE